MTTPDPKVPGKAAPGKPVEDKAADTVKSATDKVADEASGIRAEFRAIRSDEDVQTVAHQARPFIEGAIFTAAMVVDPPLAAAYGIYKTGRFVQTVRDNRRAKAAAKADDAS